MVKLKGKDNRDTRQYDPHPDRATIATRNTAHFQDISVPVVNPWIA
jgi:hypothetical protein